MTTYKELHGTNIEVRSSDPSNPVEGQVWYNSTTGLLKGASVSATGSWATGGAINTGRTGIGSAGTSNTSALGFGGRVPPNSQQTITESYDGTTWTEVNDMNTARQRLAGAGTQTAALGIGGSPGTNYVTLTESYNGSWTEVGDLNLARAYMGSAGVQTSALVFGGEAIPGPGVPLTESWNGSSWTEVNDLNTGRQSGGGAGSDNTSALAFGGYSYPPFSLRTETESWNGTSWTEVNDMNTPTRYDFASAGNQTAALAFGGQIPPNVAITEEWNGTSWTEVADLSVARNSLGGAGTVSSALAFTGLPITTSTEEWTGAGATITKTFTTS